LSEARNGVQAGNRRPPGDGREKDAPSLFARRPEVDGHCESGLRGHFNLTCTVRPDGTTYVARQAFAAPFHLSKTYWSGDILLVNVINQTAGLFGGDALTTHVIVEPDARVLLSSPSAARFHPSAAREVRLDQRLEIRADGFLDVFPEISIPQRDSRASQRTRIDVEPGGELIYLETLAPGRVAAGESFAFARFTWRTDVRLAGRLIHRERANLAPGDESLVPLRAFDPASYYAGLLVVSPKSEAWPVDFAREVAALGPHVAATRLPAGGWSLRALCPDALALRRTLRDVRACVYRRLDRPLPDPRRY
jgi:urease accessory protein